jgi:hypothetical protein
VVPGSYIYMCVYGYMRASDTLSGRHVSEDAAAPATTTGSVCANMGLQLGHRKKVVVGRSLVAGWGVFLAEPAKKGDLVGEYKGEVRMMTPLTARTRRPSLCLWHSFSLPVRDCR